jgi:hypothetical protein
MWPLSPSVSGHFFGVWEGIGTERKVRTEAGFAG